MKKPKRVKNHFLFRGDLDAGDINCLEKREKISCGVFLLYLLSSLSAPSDTLLLASNGLDSIVKIELSGLDTFSATFR
jgi:hypothetical protein